MSELGQRRLEIRLYRYRYLHCRNRAKTRYNIDLSEQDYDKLCEAFEKRHPDIWTTDSGRLEGWLDLRGTLLLCHYRPSEGLVDTLLEPPSLLGADNETPSQDNNTRVELAKAKKELAEIRNLRIFDQDFDKEFRIGDYVVFLKKKLSESSVAQDVGVWYKAQIQKALKAWKAGDMDLARALLLCLANSPVAFDPTLDPARASELLDSMAEAKIEYWKLAEEK